MLVCIFSARLEAKTTWKRIGFLGWKTVGASWIYVTDGRRSCSVEVFSSLVFGDDQFWCRAHSNTAVTPIEALSAMNEFPAIYVQQQPVLFVAFCDIKLTSHLAVTHLEAPPHLPLF